MSGFLSSLMGGKTSESAKSKNQFPDTRNEAEWQEKLTKEQYHILRQEGTERPGSSKFTGDFGTKKDTKNRTGIFKCAGCETPLYSTETKFASGCGWPAFYAGLPGKVGEGAHNDGSSRDEIWCTTCGGHLGHVFRGERNDKTYGIPKDERHCVNGAAMTFEEGPTSKV